MSDDNKVENLKPEELTDEKPQAMQEKGTASSSATATGTATTSPTPHPLPPVAADTAKAEKASSSSSSSSSSTGGLSELARQLRLLQAENKMQSIQIDRLERQLRIMADLHGVSVADLRATLTQSCQAEAYGEWQHRVASLQSQLEAAELKLSKQQQTVRSFESQVDQQKVANLELRVGELEEIQENLRAENDKLYKSLAEESGKATRLQSLCDSHQLAIDEYKKKLEQEKRKRIEATKEVRANTVSPKGTVDEQQQQQQQSAEIAKPSENSHDDTLEPVILLPSPPPQPSEQELVYKKQVEILESQLSEREKDNKLRRDQFDARFKVQDERIHDLEQQLISLYAAFNMLQQERNEERENLEKMAEQLFSADAQVARQVEHLERKKPSYHAPEQASLPVSPEKSNEAKASPSMEHKIPPSPTIQKTSNTTPMPSPASVSSHSEPSNKVIANTTTAAAAAAAAAEQVMAGYVWKRGSFNRFRKRYASLHRGFADYQLYLSDTPGGKGKAYPIILFQSSVGLIKDSNRPFSFRLRISPYDANAGDLLLSVDTKEDLDRWIGALNQAIQGKSNTGGNDDKLLGQIPMTDQEASELDAALRASLEGGEGSGQVGPALPQAPYRDPDLDAALKASLHET